VIFNFKISFDVYIVALNRIREGRKEMTVSDFKKSGDILRHFGIGFQYDNSSISETHLKLP
jgi:hypothetical protein